MKNLITILLCCIIFGCKPLPKKVRIQCQLAKYRTEEYYNEIPENTYKITVAELICNDKGCEIGKEKIFGYWSSEGNSMGNTDLIIDKKYFFFFYKNDKLVKRSGPIKLTKSICLIFDEDGNCELHSPDG